MGDSKFIFSEIMLHVMTNAIYGFHPQVVHVDFEITIIKELEHAFPAAGILGCTFHFCQSGVISKATLPCTRSICRIAVLPSTFASSQLLHLFPSTTSAPGLMHSSTLNHVLTGFLSYFEATWIGLDLFRSFISTYEPFHFRAELFHIHRSFR